MIAVLDRSPASLLCRVGLALESSVALAVLLAFTSPAHSQCVTSATDVTCTGTPNGFDGNGFWAIGLQPTGPRTVINNGTLSPNAGESGVLFYGDRWSITNNGKISKDEDIGAIVFVGGSSAGGNSTLSNTTTGNIEASNSIGAIVAGYNSSTYNLRINNSGQIYQSTGSSTVTNSGAVYLGDRSFNVSINNTATGTILGGDGSNGFHSAISSNGQVNAIVNAGMIKGVGPSSAAIYGQSSTIGILSNTATILVEGSVNPNAIYLADSTVQSIRNSKQGNITSSGSSTANSIYLSSSKIDALSNVGNIVSSGNAIELDAFSSISVIQNIGRIISTETNRYAISNSGTIGKLTNSQSNLTYYGNLPSSYLVEINGPSSYGQLMVTSPSGTTNFGVYYPSTIAPGTVYSNVITGVTASNFAGGVVPSGRYGTGAMVTQIPWYLSNSGSNWDLVTQVTPVQSVDPVVPTSSSGTSLANAVANAAATASNGGANPTLSNGTSLSGATQALTSSEVDTLINAHAEGYSSNMTILMERMAGITSSTMDRIHSPTGAGSVDRVPNKYVWGEISGYRGSVDSYDNLAGFNYGVFDIMAGVDVYRGSSVTMGVFGGGGTSNMTESSQVDQSYDSNNYYAGLYGAAFLPNAFKLSGSAGYMYSSTDAQRDIPDIGQFTGGTAKDTYSSNGAFGALKLSRPIAVGQKAVITPFIAQTYAQLWVGNVDEDGGGDFNFDIKSATAYSTVSFVGVDAVVALTDADVDPFSFVGSVRYGYDWLANDDASHEVTASSPIYGDFVQIGANMGPNSLQVAAGLQGAITDRVSVRAGVAGQLNSHGNEYGAGARLRYEF